MSAPQFQMPLFYPSGVNFDMTRGTQLGMMNIMANAFWDDMMARQMLYQVPVFNFGAFNQYPFMAGNINFNAGNFMVNNPFLGSFGGVNGANGANGADGSSTPWGAFGWGTTTPIGAGSGSGAGGKSNKELTPEERTNKAKYNKLLSLMKQIKDYAAAEAKENPRSAISEADMEALTDAIKDTKGTYTEKYEKLDAAYQEIKQKIDMDKFIKYSPNSHAYNKNSKSFMHHLLTTGFEYSDSEIDVSNSIDEMKEAIEKITDSNASTENASDIIGDLEINNYEILDVISSWNTKLGVKDKSTLKIFPLIASRYNSLKPNSKQVVENQLIKPMANALTKKAQSLVKELEDSTELEKAIKNLDTEVSNAIKNHTITGSLQEAFDKLYVLTRLTASAVLAANVTSYYGEIDSETFNNDMFMEETKADLKSEGFNLNGIETPKIKNSKTPTPEPPAAPKTEAEKLEALVGENNALKADGEKEIGGKKYNAYKSTYDNKVYVSIVDENGETKIYEYKDEKLTETTADKIKEDHAKAVKAKEEAEEAKKAQERRNEELQAAEKLGQALKEELRGYTNWFEAKLLLDKITENNVVDVLKAYNKQHRGFFKQLRTEWGTDGEKHTYIQKILTKLINQLREIAATEEDAIKLQNLNTLISKLTEYQGKDELSKKEADNIDKYLEYYLY